MQSSVPELFFSLVFPVISSFSSSLPTDVVVVVVVADGVLVSHPVFFIRLSNIFATFSYIILSSSFVNTQMHGLIVQSIHHVKHSSSRAFILSRSSSSLPIISVFFLLQIHMCLLSVFSWQLPIALVFFFSKICRHPPSK